MGRVSQTMWRHPSSISPAPTSDVGGVTRASSVSARFRKWLVRSTNIEYSGFYSLEKLYAFQIDRQSPLWLEQLYLWQTMFPTLFVAIGTELLPLQEPSLGWSQNTSFFVRMFFRALIVGMHVNIQAQELIPELQRSTTHAVLLTVVQTLPFTGTVLATAAASDVFPVPFSTLTPILPTMLIALYVRSISLRALVDQHPALNQQVVRLEKLVGFVVSLIFVYSAFGFVFRRVDSRLQVALSFVLYGIKQVAKSRMWQLSHIQDHHDLSGESVACGVHLLHALFTTTCLQTAHSNETFFVVLGLGFLHDLLAFRNLRRISRDTYAILQALERDGLVSEGNSPFDARWTAQQIEEAQPSTPVLARATTFRGVPIMLTRGAYFRHHLTTARSLRERSSKEVTTPVVSLQSVSGVSPPVSQRKARATQAVAHLLHCREVVLLRMFGDIFASGFYVSFCLGLLLVPNNNLRYFDSLRALDWTSLRTLFDTVNILILTKLVTMGAFFRLFHVYCQPSGVHQCQFVMRSQRRTIQAWLMINFLQLIDFSLIHLGNDLSFQFKWIHTKL